MLFSTTSPFSCPKNNPTKILTSILHSILNAIEGFEEIICELVF